MSLRRLADRQIVKPVDVEVPITSFATTDDIIELILYADSEGFEDTKEFSKNFNRDNLKNLWNFVRENITYLEDKHSFEVVQRPSYLWHTTNTGDCKSFSIFTASILYNMGIPYSYRFVKYAKKSNYSHVYIVAHLPDGDVILDSVHYRFNHELQYYKKLDKKGALRASSAISGFDNSLELSAGYSLVVLFIIGLVMAQNSKI